MRHNPRCPAPIWPHNAEWPDLGSRPRTLFQGLFAVNPRDAYFARALAVVEYAAGNPEGSLSAWEVAVKLDPADPAGYLGRAEVLLSTGQRQRAAEDLKKASRLDGDARLKAKAESMLGALRSR